MFKCVYLAFGRCHVQLCVFCVRPVGHRSPAEMSWLGHKVFVPLPPVCPLIHSTSRIIPVYLYIWAVFQMKPPSLFSTIFRSVSHRAFSKHLFHHTVTAYCYSCLIQVSLTAEKSRLSWENPSWCHRHNAQTQTRCLLRSLSFPVASLNVIWSTSVFEIAPSFSVLLFCFLLYATVLQPMTSQASDTPTSFGPWPLKWPRPLS